MADDPGAHNLRVFPTTGIIVLGLVIFALGVFLISPVASWLLKLIR